MSKAIELQGHKQQQLLESYYAQAEAIILAHEDPETGLMPASTAHPVHGNYKHSWVRDNVYVILAVWGLWLAYRKLDNDDRLESSVVRLMRGLLRAMMGQAAKVEKFKHTQHPQDALHALYDTHTGKTVKWKGKPIASSIDMRCSVIRPSSSGGTPSSSGGTP